MRQHGETMLQVDGAWMNLQRPEVCNQHLQALARVRTSFDHNDGGTSAYLPALLCSELVVERYFGHVTNYTLLETVETVTDPGLEGRGD